MVDMEFEPTGMIEKMGSGLRFVKRAVQADLARFKAYVELQEAKGIDYRPNDGEDEKDKDADEPQSRERDEQERDDSDRESDREDRERRRQERRERTRSS
jgi:hypothetical protein